jgi:hypothetical protein
MTMLSRAFFEHELKGLAEAFAAESGADRVATEIMLRDGVSLRTGSDPISHDTYITFDCKQGSKFGRVILPYEAIVGVGFVSDGTGTGKVGFHR